MSGTRLEPTRAQILAFRRHAGALDERLPSGPPSLHPAAWAGLQDSMPRECDVLALTRPSCSICAHIRMSR